MPGINDLITGVLHPLIVPSHVLILLSFALFLGQQIPLRIGPPVISYASALGVGLVLTTTGWPIPSPALLLAVLGFGAGLLVAIGRPLPLVVRCVLTAAAGAVLGLDSGSDATTGWAVAKMLIGTWASATVWLVSLSTYAAMAAELRKQWVSVALRVGGSWIAAISLLMLAFALRRH